MTCARRFACTLHSAESGYALRTLAAYLNVPGMSSKHNMFAGVTSRVLELRVHSGTGCPFVE